MPESRHSASPAGAVVRSRRGAIVAASALAIGLLFAATAHPQSGAAGGLLANACTSCHGPDGRSETAIPTIAGMDADAIIAAMTAFRDDSRPNTIMGRIARAYTDEEIALIAHYFSER